MNSLLGLGQSIIGTVSGLGRAIILLISALFHVPNFRKGFPLLMQQLYAVGVLSLMIVMVSGLFIGMVISLQGYTILVGYGAEGSLGPMVALSLLRELGPVVAAELLTPLHDGGVKQPKSTSCRGCTLPSDFC